MKRLFCIFFALSIISIGAHAKGDINAEDSLGNKKTPVMLNFPLPFGGFIPLTLTLTKTTPIQKKTDEQIYNYTYNLCYNYSVDPLYFVWHASQDLFNNPIDEISSVIAKEKSLTEVEPLKISKELEALVSSEPFYKALDDCYGDDENSKMLFIGGLTAADMTGKVAGVLEMVVLYKGMGQVMTKVKTASPVLYRSVQFCQWGIPVLSVVALSVDSYNRFQVQKKYLQEHPELTEAIRKHDNHEISDEEFSELCFNIATKDIKEKSNVDIITNALLNDIAKEEEKINTELGKTSDATKRQELEEKLEKLAEIRSKATSCEI